MVDVAIFEHFYECSNTDVDHSFVQDFYLTNPELSAR